MYQQYNLSTLIEEMKNLSENSSFLTEKIDFLVRRFYNHILQTEASSLFYFTNMESLYNSFHSTVQMIVTLLNNPTELITKVDSIVLAHSHLKLKNEYINDFTNSLIRAFYDIFEYCIPEQQLELYSRFISELMNLFKEKMPQIIET